MTKDNTPEADNDVILEPSEILDKTFHWGRTFERHGYSKSPVDAEWTLAKANQVLEDYLAAHDKLLYERLLAEMPKVPFQHDGDGDKDMRYTAIGRRMYRKEALKAAAKVFGQPEEKQ